MTNSSKPLTEHYEWSPQPAAAALVEELYETFLEDCPPARALAQRLLLETGTSMYDWVDHYTVHRSAELEEKLASLGFFATKSQPEVWDHPQGMFPRIVLDASKLFKMTIKADSVADFLVAQDLDDRTLIEGVPLGPWRRAKVFGDAKTELWVIERHGQRGFEAVDVAPELTSAAMHYLELFRRRNRRFKNDGEGFAHASKLVRAAAKDIGLDWTCDLFFIAEREYWQRRNRAGQVQKARQDRLGLGWANHDHHTYRSSREHFAALVSVLEELGFVCRERFYAGREAGWGAQILEQPQCGVIIFADVDLTPDEVAGDFSHEPLSPQPKLGTVGLWCQLHGEAFLQAGMHHLECQFDFDAAREQLKAASDIETMRPFTDFSFLRQAFTQGEIWPIDPERIQVALDRGYITPVEADKFRQAGALGSHLEILQRKQGYRGFNQTGISEIIRDTDPRRRIAGSVATH